MLAGGIALVALLLAACQPTNPPTRPGTQRVVMYGDSVPAWLIGKGSDRGVDLTKFTLLNGTMSACDGSLPFYDARWTNNDVVPVTDACKQGWRKQYPPFLQTRPDVAVVMGGMHTMLDHKIGGAWVHPCKAEARNWYREDIKARLNYLKAHSNRVVLVLPAWPGPNSRWIMPVDYVKRADCVRQVMADAAAVRGVPTIDFGAYLCPTSPTVCKPYRNDDGIHIDVAKAPTVLKWLLTTVGST